jgi:ParB family transcriptional regulator, chromosome partitioning protein
MSEAKRVRTGLGRGLGALMGDVAPIDSSVPSASAAAVRSIPISALSPHPHQPRRRFDQAALEELAESIATRGILQPIVVRPHGHGYQIVAGERRWRAAQRAQLHEVPVVVRDFDDGETLQIAIIENIQRQDLNAIEEAQAFDRLMHEFGHTQEVLAKVVHKSRSHVANLLRLLDLPASVQAKVAEGQLSMGHARALIGAGDVERLADQVIARGLSVRETEKLASAAKRPDAASSQREGRAGDADLAALETQLADLLGLKVRISHGARGGSVTLDYSTLDQLDMICQRLSGEAI